MNVQYIISANGERMAVLPEADYAALVSAAEDASDIAEAHRIKALIAAGEVEMLPEAMVKAMVNGENLVRLWREHRGLSAKSLAEATGIAASYLSQIESGKREGTINTMSKIASALKVSLDDLV